MKREGHFERGFQTKPLLLVTKNLLKLREVHLWGWNETMLPYGEIGGLS